MAGQPFANDAVGGTILLVPAVQSPNFSVANQTGWAIYQDGSAVFFSLDIVGGSIMGPHYSIDDTGLTFFDAVGRVIGQWLWASGLQMYNPPPSGELVMSMSQVATTDQFGNTIPLGVSVGQNNQVQVQLGLNGPAGILQFNLNNGGFTSPVVEGAIFGVPSYAQMYLSGPANTAAGHTDNVGVEFNSSDGTSSANLTFSYFDANGAQHQQGYLDYTGIQLAASICRGVQPGTGTSPVNAAVAETWHNLPLTGWTVATGGYHAMYRMTALGDVELSGRITTTGTSSTITTALPSGYYPATSPLFSTPVAVLTAGAITANQTPRIAISNAGVITVAGITVASGTTLSLDGITFPVSAG